MAKSAPFPAPPAENDAPYGLSQSVALGDISWLMFGGGEREMASRPGGGWGWEQDRGGAARGGRASSYEVTPRQVKGWVAGDRQGR